MSEDKTKIEQQPRSQGGQFASKDSEKPVETPEDIRQLKAEFAEMKQMIAKQDEREIAKQYESQRTEKIAKLRLLKPQLADKYKDESSLDKLDMLIDTAQAFASDFPEYSKAGIEAEKPQLMGYIDPKTGKVM